MECGGVDEWSSDTSQVDRPTNAQMICRLVKSTNHCDLYPKIEVVRVPKTVYKTYVGAILSPKNSLTKAQYLHFRYLKMVDFFVIFSWSLGRRAASSEGESHLAVFFQEKSGDVVTLVSKLCHSWQTIDRTSFIEQGWWTTVIKKDRDICSFGITILTILWQFFGVACPILGCVSYPMTLVEFNLQQWPLACCCWSGGGWFAKLAPRQFSTLPASFLRRVASSKCKLTFSCRVRR